MQHLFLFIYLLLSVQKWLAVLFSKSAFKSVIMFWLPARKMCHVITQIIRFML